MRLPALIALLCLANHAAAQEPEPDAGAISAPSERVDALSRSALYRDVLQRERQPRSNDSWSSTASRYLACFCQPLGLNRWAACC
ncbi:hypothetical protein ULG90_13360 [Halopseudomonas pachastrellae]|nr:hypothetical protein ULG90_13360 [Halopseudomonas pachastrellae]